MNGRFGHALFALIIAATGAHAQEATAEKEAAVFEPLDYTIRVDTVLKHDDGEFIWFHPRVAAIPGAGKDGGPAVIMTLQKHLHVSDHYSGLYEMRTDDLGVTWIGPTPRAEMDWVTRPDDEVEAMCDVTPGWHAQAKRLLAIGAKVRYREDGEQLYDKPRSRAGAYSVFDPRKSQWYAWRVLSMPDVLSKFFGVTPGCVQWLAEPDGSVLLPIYFFSGSDPNVPSKSTVVRCSFDGRTLRYVEHGDELELNVVRGLVEPSLAKFGGRYYLTLRNDERGYVTVGDDGLHFAPIQPWTFDDGEDLGSYNTQQLWLTHSDGLFLVYTRRGANNDHIMRHRAPLFIAQVDPEKCCVVRSTERVLIPERGAQMGNFGAASITAGESWVTVSEGMWGEARQRGAEGATFVARVLWSTPNRLVAEHE
ncbi:MAG TPA: exo-alpha-sialidase [Candidatus Hydrogenedentes bacterium]|nr:exo-alpha-sialidase [Candidatus Hydrogenedentota bacterium]HPG65950.1 exo-alpha-sialidase [Candidatus Hydrogenedentota bacterium]